MGGRKYEDCISVMVKVRVKVVKHQRHLIILGGPPVYHLLCNTLTNAPSPTQRSPSAESAVSRRGGHPSIHFLLFLHSFLRDIHQCLKICVNAFD